MARTAGSVGTETAESIRAVALKLFAAHGYRAVSTRQIAASVGVQAPALYNYFPNKQALLSELMVSHMESLIAAWQEEAVAGEAPVKALERFCRFHIHYHAGRADEVFISYMELRNLEPANFKQVEALRRDYEKFVCAILQQGADSGDFVVADARVAGMAIIAMLSGVNTWYRSRGRLSLAAIEDMYTGMVLRSAGVQFKEDLCSAAE